MGKPCFHFLQEIFGMHILPGGRAPQWRGGGSSEYTLCWWLVHNFVCIFVRMQGFFMMYVCEHPCAHALSLHMHAFVVAITFKLSYTQSFGHMCFGI